MVPSIDVSVEVPHDYLFFILIDSIHHNLGNSFKALYNFVLGIRADWHVDYMKLGIPYFYTDAPSLLQ